MTLSKIINVVDIKTTCWDPEIVKTPEMVEEVILFGIAAVDTESLEILECSTNIIRPLSTNAISDYCLNKTGISAQNISWGYNFSYITNLKDFKLKNRVLATWSNNDKNILINNCRLHNMEFPFNEMHFNLGYSFSLMNGLSNQLDVAEAKFYLKINSSNLLGQDRIYNDLLDKANILISFLGDHYKFCLDPED